MPDPKKKISKPIKVEGNPARYNELLIDTSDTRLMNQLSDKFKKIHLNSNSSCTAGSLNCLTDFVQPVLGSPSVRSMTQQNNNKYKIASKERLAMGNSYVPNNSIDAWEIHNQLSGEGLGKNLINPKSKLTYKKNNKGKIIHQIPNELDYKNLPIGTILGQGDSAGVYTDPKEGTKSRHAMTIIGYDKTDGEPLVYDYGKIRRLSDNKGVDGSMPINNVTIPKGYEKYNKSYIDSQYNNYSNTLGYGKDLPIDYGSEKEYIKSIQKGVNSVKNQIGRDYGLSQEVINNLSYKLPGIANQESGINNNERLTKSRLIDNTLGNYLIKPGVKAIENAYTFVTNLGKDDGEKKKLYQIELDAYKKFPNDPKKRLTYQYYLKNKNDQLKDNNYQELSPSVGPFSVKNVPEYSKTKLGLDKGNMYGIKYSNSEELENGSKVALNILAENYKRLQKDYPNLNEKELSDLTVTSYNNASKQKDKEYVDYYIKNHKLKDDYVEKVNSFQTKENKKAIAQLPNQTQSNNSFANGGNIEPPIRSAYENELMSRVITERNKDKNFVQRALNPSAYPYIVNDDGSKTTHLMQYSTDNNGNAFVSPTVIQNELGLLSKLTPREAVQYGRKTGEEIQIPNAQLADYYSSNGLIKHADGGQINNNLSTKYNDYLNNNMKRYAEGGTLNQFNVGGTHEQNPNGGIPQGPNAMVEQGETSTKTPNGKYIYSDRLYINEDLVKQFNLPNSIKGKTFADASKVIDKPFKDKNSNPDKMTHKEHLDRLKQAQETLKAEEAQKEQAIMQNAQQSPGFENQQVPQGMEEFVGPQEMPQEGMEQAMQQPGMSAYGGFIKRYDKGGMVDFLDENQGMFGTVDGIGKQFQSGRAPQPGDKGADAAKSMTTTALNAFIPGAGTAAGAADSLITGIAGDSKVGKGIASMVSPLGTIKGIGSALETGNISDMPMVGMFTGNSTFEKQKVQQARSSATSANNAFSDKFAEGGELEFTVSNPNNVAPMNYAPVNYVTTPTDSGQNIRFNSSGYSPLEMRNDKFIQEAGTILRKDANGNILTMPQLRENQKMYNYTKNAPDRYYVNKWLLENPGKTEKQYSKAIEKREKAKDVGQQGLNDGYSKAGKACITETSSSTKDIKAEGGYMNYFDKGGDTAEASDNWFERNGGKMLKYAPIAMNAFQLSQLKKPSGVVLDRLSNRYKPMYMDENRIQNQVSNEMNNSVAGLTNATAGSESALRANLVGTTTGRIKGMSDAYAKMNEYNAGQNLAGQQFNLGVDQANIGQSNNQLEINDRNQANYRNQRSKLLGSIGTDLGSVGKEEVNKNSLAEALGYTWDGKFYVHNKTGAKKTAEQVAGETTQHAYGGYLRMNKIGRR